MNNDEYGITPEEQAFIDGLDESAPKEEPTPAPEEEQPVEAAPVQEELPEKWRGKSISDVVKSYSELERKLSEIGSERKFYQDQLEAMRQQQTQQRPEQTPQFDFDRAFDEDPKEAIKRTYQSLQEKLEQQTTQAALAQRQQAYAQELMRQRRENADFVKREPQMAQLLAQVQQFVKPEFHYSPEVLNALYYIARGTSVDEYVKEAVEQSAKQKQQTLDEKRRAQSESAYSRQEANSIDISDEAFEKLPQKEQEKLLDKMMNELVQRKP